MTVHQGRVHFFEEPAAFEAAAATARRLFGLVWATDFFGAEEIRADLRVDDEEDVLSLSPEPRERVLLGRP